MIACGFLHTFGEDHSIQVKNLAAGVAELRFVAHSTFFYRLESTVNISEPFQPVGAWVSGNNQLIRVPIYYGTNALLIPPESEAFTIYSFTNGQSLVLLPGTNETLHPVLLPQNYNNLPPFYFQPASSNGGALRLFAGSLKWNPSYSNYALGTQSPEDTAKALQFSSRFQEITNSLTQGGPPGWTNFGPGLRLSGEKQFFRVVHFDADQDADGLDWAAETFLTGTNPINPDSNLNGINDGLEDRDGDHIPDADEISFGLNLFVDETTSSSNLQRYSYDSLRRLRTVDIPGSLSWILTPDAQGNITKAGQ